VSGNYFLANTLQAAASVTTPGAGATLATLGVILPGVYSIAIDLVLTGTIAAAERNNVRLVFNASNYGPLLLPDVINLPQNVIIDRLMFDGVNPVLLQAIALATTGAIYHAQITATKITPAS